MVPRDWLKQRGKIYRRWLNAIRVEQHELARHGIVAPELALMAEQAQKLADQIDTRRAPCPPHTTT